MPGINYAIHPLTKFEARIPLRMYKVLVDLKFKTGLSISEHIRRAIDDYFQKLGIDAS